MNEELTQRLIALEKKFSEFSLHTHNGFDSNQLLASNLSGYSSNTSVYGEMYYPFNVSGVNEVMNGSDKKVTAFSTNGVSSGTTPDHSNDKITVGSAGKYLAVVEMSAYAGNYTFEIVLGVNGTVVEKTRRYTHYLQQAGTSTTNAILDLTANQYVEVFLKGTGSATVAVYALYMALIKL